VRRPGSVGGAWIQGRGPPLNSNNAPAARLQAALQFSPDASCHGESPTLSAQHAAHPLHLK